MQREQSQAYRFKIRDIVSYLHQNGWQEITHPNPRLIVFQGAADDEGNPIQLVLPSQKNAGRQQSFDSQSHKLISNN
ncbi:MAG: hypothetical protein AAFX46_01620 [Cyanobacteria bacterium J06636_27]